MSNSHSAPPLLDEYQSAELREAFDAFDDDRTGRLDVPTFKVLIRALGFRVTGQEVFRDVKAATSAKMHRNEDGDEDFADGLLTVDFNMACDLLARRFANRDPEREARESFRLFDSKGLGSIDADDLRRVANEVGDVPLGPAEAEAMIEEFDRDLDGRISYEEFRRIVLPPPSDVAAAEKPGMGRHV